MKTLLLLTAFLMGCQQLPVREAGKLIEEMREQGCEVAATSVSKKKVVVRCK